MGKRVSRLDAVDTLGVVWYYTGHNLKDYYEKENCNFNFLWSHGA